MNKIYELSWLWKSLGIALAAAAVAVALAALICRAAKKKLGKKAAVIIGICDSRYNCHTAFKRPHADLKNRVIFPACSRRFRSAPAAKRDRICPP